jgi:acetylornithine/succinyldiaminopimelate/putrescine aminotransferase
MMENTEKLQREIDQTQQEIHENLEALQDKLSPEAAMEKGKAFLSDGLNAAKDAVSKIKEEGTVDAQGKVQRNLVAFGLLTFAAGVAVGALIPPTEVEREKAAKVKAKVAKAAEPVVDTAKTVAEEASDTARTIAAEAKEGVSTLKNQP